MDWPLFPPGRCSIRQTNSARHGRLELEVVNRDEAGGVGREVELGQPECVQLIGHEARGELLVVVVQHVTGAITRM